MKFGIELCLKAGVVYERRRPRADFLCIHYVAERLGGKIPGRILLKFSTRRMKDSERVTFWANVDGSISHFVDVGGEQPVVYSALACFVTNNTKKLRLHRRAPHSMFVLYCKVMEVK